MNNMSRTSYIAVNGVGIALLWFSQYACRYLCLRTIIFVSVIW